MAGNLLPPDMKTADRILATLRLSRDDLASRLTRWRARIARTLLLPNMRGDPGADLRGMIRAEGTLTSGYMLMCVLSAGIAILGLLQSSTAVVIGAMLVSPLMAPIASLGFGFASLDGHWIRDSARVVIVGAALGILTAILLTLASPIRDATPEIIARTQPTLLDLAVALLSGIAGGYATVRQKGGTAIGVAIATALMPPLATVGYGIAVMQPVFALGATLLFLTNLAAIAFAFAVVARLSGAARPRQRVEWTARYITITVLCIAALATPLAISLRAIVTEARARSAVIGTANSVFDSGNARIAQMDIRQPLFGGLQIDAVIITPDYLTDGESQFKQVLQERIGEEFELNVQQVLAADIPAQTRALVDAAMERTRAGIAADVAPLDRIRSAIGLPLQAVWTNRAERVVEVVPAPAPGWSLQDYRKAEAMANQQSEPWTVRVSPPVTPRLIVRIGDSQTPEAVSPELALWAIERWGVKRVRTSLADTSDASGAFPQAVALSSQLLEAGVQIVRDPALRGEAGGSAQVLIEIFPPRPE